MKIRPTFRIFAIFAVASALSIVSMPGSAQITKQGTGYVFRYGFKKGATYKYSAKITNQMGASPVVQKLTYSMKVVKVEKDVASLEYVYTMPGADPKTKPQPQTVKMNRMGKVSMGDTAMQAAMSEFPAKAVKINETWKSKGGGFATPGGTGSAEVTYRLISVKKMGKRQVAEIRMFVIFNAGAVKGKANGTQWLDMADGMPVKQSLKATSNFSQNGKASTATSTVQVDRL